MPFKTLFMTVSVSIPVPYKLLFGFGSGKVNRIWIRHTDHVTFKVGHLYCTNIPVINDQILPELLTVGQDDVHVFVKRFELTNKGPRVLKIVE